MAETESRFQTLDRTGVAEDTVAQIQRLIIEGRLVSGERLPPERQLGSMLGVSRPTLRESIRALEMMGIVEVRHGDGTYISDLRPSRLMRPMEFLLAIDKHALTSLFEVRKLIEGGAAALAATRATDEQREEFRGWLDEYPGDDIEPDPEWVLVRDLAMHSLVVAAAHNPLLVTIAASLARDALQSRAVTRRIPGLAKRGMQELQHVAERVLARDENGARDSMIRHLAVVQAGSILPPSER